MHVYSLRACCGYFETGSCLVSARATRRYASCCLAWGFTGVLTLWLSASHTPFTIYLHRQDTPHHVLGLDVSRSRIPPAVPYRIPIRYTVGAAQCARSWLSVSLCLSPLVSFNVNNLPSSRAWFLDDSSVAPPVALVLRASRHRVSSLPAIGLLTTKLGFKEDVPPSRPRSSCTPYAASLPEEGEGALGGAPAPCCCCGWVRLLPACCPQGTRSGEHY